MVTLVGFLLELEPSTTLRLPFSLHFTVLCCVEGMEK